MKNTHNDTNVIEHIEKKYNIKLWTCGITRTDQMYPKGYIIELYPEGADITGWDVRYIGTDADISKKIKKKIVKDLLDLQDALRVELFD